VPLVIIKTGFWETIISPNRSVFTTYSINKKKKTGILVLVKEGEMGRG